jgi:hypothetical protein
MKVDVSTRLDCSAEKAWTEAVKTSVLTRVIWPMARIVPADQGRFPERWSEGLTLRCKSFLWGFIPIGVRMLHFETVDNERFRFCTREHDSMVKRWDHVASVVPDGEKHSIYRDVIEIDAGKLTFLVWLWACWFYRHRQRRWRALARTL